MIFGIGTDIVRVARMQKDLERFGERFAERILTDSELREFSVSARPAHFLARRFAAKEAAAKAMGTGFSHGLALRHIGVIHDEAGKPLLEFTDAALEFMRQRGITTSHISLSDEEDHAVAFVTLEKD
jgi:holo-[acyl-carrier protein] synthase